MTTPKDTDLSCISVQDYGGLIVMDLQFILIGISTVAAKQINQTPENLIGISMEDFLQQAFESLNSKLSIFVKNASMNDLPRQILGLRVNGSNYYFKCNKNKNLIYLEWEPQLKKYLSATKLNEIGFLLDRSYPNKWDMVCRAVNSFLNFDRVFVLQVYETGLSKIISEDCRKNSKLKLNKEFSESLMTQETLSYFQSAAYRYVPNIGSAQQQFYYTDDKFDPLCTQLAPLPILYKEYFISLGINSAIFFPLIVNGKFWGLVVGYHTGNRVIDLQQRKLCAIFVQNAASKFESNARQITLEKNEHFRSVENLIKERLYQDKSINCTMIGIMDILNEMTRSDGVAIYNEGELFFHGHTPNSILFKEIINYINNHTKKIIFKDHNFRLNHGDKFASSLNFAGILSYRLDHDSDYYIVWFRKEKQTKITHIDKSSKPNSNLSEHEQESQIITWERNIQDSSIAWDDDDLNFIHALQSAINESIIHKSKEKERLSEELETMNNELEMFTFTLAHDLKNPLSILGSGLHFLTHNAHNIPKEKLVDWHKNLSSNIGNISDIIDNIVFLSQNKIKAFTKDPIPMRFSVKKIVQETILLYDSKHSRVIYGKLYPVWGEKSALYQVFTNIIGNAIKYSKSEENAKVSIRSFLYDDHVHYCIRDNGIGIPKHNINSIFDMFNRADNALAHKGSGIGLTLAKRIMDRLGGTIKIRSVKSKGTQIDLYFPLIEGFPKTMLSNI
ncbi:ATP-binding protein [Sphingobacterium sp. MYb382]|uniref:ATP-binding protein n=1 Tax=Sphingobacterium sp. MYb382 TaxID=2745278 RepID=UPI0030987CD6